MKEILHAEQISQPGRGFYGVRHAGADKPRRIQIDHCQQQQIERPDAQRPARMEVMKVARIVAPSQQIGSNQKTAEDKKENHTRPAPERSVVQPASHEPRMAVVEHHAQNRQAAQPVEFRHVFG
jgi:hypothetical protein